MAERGGGTARDGAATVAKCRATLRIEAITRAMEFAKVRESLTAGTVGQLGLPSLWTRRRFTFRQSWFSWLPFGGVEIRFAIASPFRSQYGHFKTKTRDNFKDGWEEFDIENFKFLIPQHVFKTQKKGTERDILAQRGCLLSHGRYPCVACGGRGRLQGGNVGRNLGAERVIHIVGVGGRHRFRRADQAEVGVGGRNDRVTASATRISVSEMQDGREVGWGTSLNSRGWRS